MGAALQVGWAGRDDVMQLGWDGKRLGEHWFYQEFCLCLLTFAFWHSLFMV
jgi:hypothetical protein